MAELSIKIKIGDREYPMRVDANEEERLRAAGRLINEKIRGYQSQFGIDDKQDLLAMVAFDVLIDKLRTENSSTNFNSSLNEKLEGISSIIESAYK